MSKRIKKFVESKKRVVKVVIKSKPDFGFSDDECPLSKDRNGFCYKEKDFPPLAEKEKFQSDDCGVKPNPPTSVSVNLQKVVGFEEEGYKKVCVSYQNEGNEKITDMVRGKSMVSEGGKVVCTAIRIPCIVSGCVSTFSRNDVMLRHLRSKHKMQRCDPNYPGNQCVNPAQSLDVAFGEVGYVAMGVGEDLAQGGNWTIMTSPRKMKEDIKRKTLDRKKRQERRNLKFEESKAESCLRMDNFSPMVDVGEDYYVINKTLKNVDNKKGKEDGGDVGGDPEPAQDQNTDGEGSEGGGDPEHVQEAEPSKKKKKRSQRKRSTLHIVNYSSGDTEEETSSKFSDEVSLFMESSLEGLVCGNADDFENLGYSSNTEDSYIQNSLLKDSFSENTLGDNSIRLDEDKGVSARKSICQVFESSLLDEGLIKINEYFDDMENPDKSEHSLIQDSVEVGLEVEESKSDSGTSEKLKLLKQRLKITSDEIKRIEKEEKRKKDGKSMISKAKIRKIEKSLKNNGIEKSFKNPRVVSISVSCPYCDKAFSSVFNLKRHIVSIHNIAENTVRELNFEATSKKCLHCGKWQKNLAKHVKICSKKKELDSKIEAMAERRIAILADGGVKSHVKGGVLFMERIEDWYEHHSKQTRGMYLRKIKNILHYWEANIPNFIASKLLYPLEYNISLPTLDSYLKTETDSVKATSMKAYMQICDFVNDNLRNKYSSDENYSPLVVTTWSSEVLSFKHAMSGKLKTVNRKASLNTILNKKASKEKYGDSDLKQNAVRCKVLYRILNQHSGIQEELKDIVKMSPCKLANEWDEQRLRSFLVGLLIVTGGGARPHVTTRMTIGEFQQPFTGPKGNKAVHVHNHKTVNKFGPAPLIFILPRLYDACSSYRECFRSNATSENLLFESSRGTEMKPIIGTEYIQNNFLKSELSEDEKRNFTPKIWRQAWTNWTRELSDPELRDIGNFTMGHSEAVIGSNYIDLSGPNALKFGNKILEDVLRSDDCFSHDQEQCESFKVVDHPEKLCEQSDKVHNQQRQGQARIYGRKTDKITKVVRPGTVFTEKERLLIRKAFCDKNDHPPKSFTEGMIQKEIKINPIFRQVYESLTAKKTKLLKSKGWTTSNLASTVKVKCRNTIRKCINARHKSTKLSGNFDTFVKRPMKVKSVSLQNESDSETYSDESVESTA